MSSAVVPFAQQGSVDWVALSNFSAHFSIGVLARLSKDGLDPFTLQMGRAICSDFTITSSFQQSLTDAIHGLKKYGSYGNVLGFGFGLKHIVTELSETEEGLACVSLCAALSTIYDNLYSAQVLRDLCRLQKAPELFTPALQQWRTLVTLSSGILMSHRFSLLLNTFRTLISKQLHHPILTCQKATSSLDLARAILNLAYISKGKLLDVTFTGGLDCAWLAAYAEVVLSLNVEILGSDEVDAPLYRSRSDAEVTPQVRFLLCNTASSEPLSKQLLMSKTSFIESGRTLIKFMESDSRALRWRAPWASILRETFREAVDQLLNDTTGRTFMTFLYCSSDFLGVDRMLKLKIINRPISYASILRLAGFPMRFTAARDRAEKFLHFAIQQLPELASCTQGGFSVLLLPDTLETMDIEAMKALQVIKKSCSCEFGLENKTNVCLITLAHTILEYLRILLSSTIEEDVLPSVPGLLSIYTCQYPSCERIVNRFGLHDLMFEREGLGFVLRAFSGMASTGPTPPRRLGAATNEGICVYHEVIENPEESPTSIANYPIARGYISHDGSLFTGIQHRATRDDLDSSLDSLSIVRSPSSIMTVDTVVEETNDEKVLELGFRVTYVDKDTRHHRCLWLDFSYIIFDEPGRNSVYPRCSGNCRALYNVKEHLCSRWMFTFDPASVDTAQEALNRIKGRYDMWMLMIQEGQTGELVRLNVIERYLLLYLIMSKIPGDNLWTKKFLLCPFVRCLTCLFQRGVDQLIRKVIQNKINASGSIELVSADDDTTNDPDLFKLTWRLKKIPPDLDDDLTSESDADGGKGETPGDITERKRSI